MKELGQWLIVAAVAAAQGCGASLATPGKDAYLQGDKYFSQGEYEKAIEAYSRAIQHSPENYGAYVNRGSAYDMLGDFGKAIADYTTAINGVEDRNDKRLGEIYYNRGFAHERHGDFGEAVADYKETLRLDASVQDVHNNLAWILATCPHAKLRNGSEAVKHATLACEETAWKDVGVLDTLAAAYAEAGKFAEAVKWAEKALSKAPADMKEEFEARLQLYKEGKPYHQSPGD